ncbi:flagellar hook-associated 2 domain-containing protein [Caldicellulosiruptor owensensis OL]|uniref:Flagellar hook-associated protein 2 n=1 Tax=Caldicellulosiruptor owensensis (strain ATCC 700167 / DSM 13100 / OL) TaxID=632518 RepID=E4Q2K7_CALOW|nr:flagellar filament capping protein FliD [Caldicellulosiruptor owensensis]ADQ04949.1 flagellar hook-associated 2 domain-containing protein [Caldicellulosiruptor owensensis OL]
MNVSSTTSTGYTNPYDVYKYYTRIGGLASGLDTDSIIKGLMGVEKQRYNKLYQQKQLLEWQRQDYMDIANAISSFKDYVFNLKLSSNFIKYKTTGEAVDSGYVSITGTANALEGNYQIKVEQLATQANAVVSDLTIITKDSENKVNLKIDLTVGSLVISKNISLVWNPTDSVDTFGANLAKEINSAFSSDKSLRAYYDPTIHKLIISSQKTGSNVNFSIKDLNNNSQIASATGTDAKVYIKDSFNNESFISSPANTVNVYGMSITLNKTTVDSSNVAQYKSFSISKDVDAIVNNIKEFINKYNDLVSKIYSKITEKRNRDYLPLTEEQKSQMKDTDIQKWEEAAKKGLLYGDSILSSYLGNMRNYLYKQVTGLPSNLDTISEAGIETYSYFESKEGKIYIKDESKLRDAIANNFDAFVKLFTNSGNDTTSVDDDGILLRFYNLANDTLKKIYDKAGKPYFANSYDPNSSIGKQLRSIVDQMNAEQDRLKKIEDRYYKQFSQLESLMAQMSIQSSWLSQQFSSK